MLEAEEWYWATSRGRDARLVPAVRSMLPCAHADTLAARLRVSGPRHTVVTACSSGAVAMAEAAALIADGVVDIALAGGGVSITRICCMGVNAVKLLDPAACRPFDRDRRGMSIGEGAGFVGSRTRESAGARRPCVREWRLRRDTEAITSRRRRRRETAGERDADPPRAPASRRGVSTSMRTGPDAQNDACRNARSSRLAGR